MKRYQLEESRPIVAVYFITNRFAIGIYGIEHGTDDYVHWTFFMDGEEDKVVRRSKIHYGPRDYFRVGDQRVYFDQCMRC